MLRTTSLRILVVSFVVAGFAACGGGDNQQVGDTAIGEDAADVPGIDRDAVVSFDIAADTAEPPPDVTGVDIDPDAPPGDREFGAPCQGNADCDSGWCVESNEGYVCTVPCIESCPDGYDCKSVQNNVGDVTFLCLPRVQRVCTPCLEDFQCNGGACLTIDNARRCASRCTDSDECPRGYTCAADPLGATSGLFCQPNSGSCDCTPAFDGVQRTCTRANGLGTCFGVETCDGESGWVGCNANEPVPETCNYQDDDCNGSVDDTFKNEEGAYADDSACGSCNTNCADSVPNAAETACVVSQGIARCQVVACDPGYVPLNDFVCIPDAGNLCQPCTVDAECAGIGARCVNLDDGRFCGRACTTTADCAEGFDCSDIAELGVRQCVPTSGSCTCDGTDTDLARACSVSYTPPGPNQPQVTCKGFERCTSEGWGSCELPEEACDGIDNNCDGNIDELYRTGERYTALEHCGACRVNCAALQRPNTVPRCDTTPAVPQCGYTCAGNAVDVNGLSDDGCECVPTAGPDLVGDGLDSNCDGIDGEVDNGIFVSRDGAANNPGTRELPVLTLQAGIDLAVQRGKRDVYVATGVYSENIVLANGIGVFGGYSPFFDERAPLLYETAMIGQAPDATRLGTVTAIDLGNTPTGAATILDGFSVFGPNAANIAGANSYAVYVRNSGSGLRISNNRIFAGPGGPGGLGTAGTNGDSGVAGANGVAAKDTNGCPPATGSNGGAGGARTCSTTDVGGGAGGFARCADYGTTPGSSNNGAAGRGPSPGSGGAAGWDLYVCQVTGTTCDTGSGVVAKNCGACYLPPDDNPFTAASGTNGAAGTDGGRGLGCAVAGGAVVDGHWRGNAGAAGLAGGHGSGGGGGGAGAGVEVSGTSCSTTNGDDDVGGSGGGGGSGGCRGNGGTGGTAGGGSFGIFVVRTTNGTVPDIVGNTIRGGTGGPGGAGGTGGVGGTGGTGGTGGAAGDQIVDTKARCAQGGGAGGAGGRGGHGGGGGGGCGGASYGLFVSLSSGTPPAAWKTNNTFVLGVGGVGGNGGPAVVASSAGSAGSVGTAATTNY